MRTQRKLVHLSFGAESSHRAFVGASPWWWKCSNGALLFHHFASQGIGCSPPPSPFPFSSSYVKFIRSQREHSLSRMNGSLRYFKRFRFTCHPSSSILTNPIPTPSSIPGDILSFSASVCVGNLQKVDRRGASPAAGARSVRGSGAFYTTGIALSPADVSPALAADLKKIISHDRIVLFLTGTPEAPRCRFTVQLIDLMEQLEVQYGYFNILEDDEICEGLKQYSDWPTYPQVYVDGELLGGFDVMKEMMCNGTLTAMLKKKGLIK